MRNADSDLQCPAYEAPTRVRYRVLAFLCALSFVLYVDRNCIGQAATDIQADLGISKPAMGVVFGAFTVAFALPLASTLKFGMSPACGPSAFSNP